jgi:site-specific recombinase XerD
VLDTSLYKKSYDGLGRGFDTSPCQILENYLLNCEVEDLSPVTIESYHYKLKPFISSIKKISDVTPNHIRLLLKDIKQRVSPITLNAHYRALNTFFNWLVTENLLGASPMSNIKAPKIPYQSRKGFNKQDIQNLIIVTSGSRFVDIRNRAIILLLLDTGIRLNELVNIQLRDINSKLESIRIMGKGSKERYVRIGKQARRALLKYLVHRRDTCPYLWITQLREAMKREGMRITIRRLCKWAEIRNVKYGAHTFRHTAAKCYLRNGGDVFTLKMMLGHSTLQMTEQYLRDLEFEDMARVHIKASPVDNLIK